MPINKILTFRQAEDRYGKIVDGVWKAASEWCVALRLDCWTNHVILNSITREPVTHIYINKDMKEPLTQVLLELNRRDLITEIHTFEGCYVVRPVRGCHQGVSTHSYALALDFNAKQNWMRTKGHWSPDFVDVWREAGFIWGGDFHHRTDPMHFQWACF